MYMLSMISHRRETGYSIMQSISEKTQGIWRPGPGTIYPLLRRLVKEGLTKPVDSGDSVLYALTEKGNLELEEMRCSLIARGTDEVMMSLFCDLLPVSFLTTLFHKHYRAEFDIFAEKITQAKQHEREAALKEMEGTLKGQLSWVRSELGRKTKKTSR